MANEDLSLIPTDDAPVPDRLPVLPLTGTVAFPHAALPMAVTDERIARVVADTDDGNKQILLLALRPQRSARETDPGDPPFFEVGTLGTILQRMEAEDGDLRLLVQGRTRRAVQEFQHDDGVWYARTEPRPDEAGDGLRVQALQHAVLELFRDVLSHSHEQADAIVALLKRLDNPAQLADFVSAHLDVEVERKQELLEEARVPDRLEAVARLLGQQQKVLEYGSEIQQKIQEEVEKTQREVWLREQLKVIRNELGEGEENEIERLRERIDGAAMPDPVKEHAHRELGRMERTLPQLPEYHTIQNYLDWLVALPWGEEDGGTIDLDRAREILDRDHYDLEEVKERIVEYLAVRKLNPERQGPILCFVGPPGVGKTSLGRSIAEALGRKFTRASLGGMRDEAEIRGHRRTYVGALPGKILQRIRQVGVRNPVFMLDEIDKVGADFRGDPTAALLEVLDPAQNHEFSDHYLEVPFDLSRVLFIATGNTLATVPPALKDRLEVLEVPGYTSREKFEIARRFLLERQRREAGLEAKQVSITDDALRRLIAEYTREAGVRELERQIGRLMRKVALRVVEADGGTGPVSITVDNLKDFAGTRRFEEEMAGRRDEVGTATALAYTPAGGQILFVEVLRVPGEGEVRLTGHLGDVMKESAQAAVSYVRSHVASEAALESRDDVHVHVPAGATPKDGPSAGVALVVALASLFTGRPVRRDVAMTGEVTLRGHVLPVGGIREKLIAASQAGIHTVLLPRRNEVDLDDLPGDVGKNLRIVLIEDVSEAFEHALVEQGRPGDRSPRQAPS